MGCTSCSTNTSGVPGGCKSNGACATGSCDKLTVFDWLSNMALPSGQKSINIAEVRFKNGRKQFFRNTNNFQLTIGEIIAVEGAPGHDIGAVSLTGELVRVQMKKKKVSEDSDEVKKIYRKATPRDIKVWQTARDREVETQKRGREIILRLGLKMKLSDVEYQGDGNKATFYYTAEDRVDFRQLIKEMAGAFSIRIEMKQVGLRQEAARLGGVGSCGRELCCSTWLTDFRKVNTASARYQQLSLNPQKLAGQCGKLKCCLNFELDSYLDALKGFPKQDLVLETEKGKATFVKMDIFKELVWYASKEEGFKWFKLTLEQVNEVIEMNKRGEKSPSLEELESETIIATKIDFENVVGQDSLTRFDAPKTKNKRRNKNRKPSRSKQIEGNKPQNKQGQKTEKISDSPQNRETSAKNTRGNKNQNRNQKTKHANANPNSNKAKKTQPKERVFSRGKYPNKKETTNTPKPEYQAVIEGNLKSEAPSTKSKKNNPKIRNTNNNNQSNSNAPKDA